MHYRLSLSQELMKFIRDFSRNLIRSIQSTNEEDLNFKKGQVIDLQGMLQRLLTAILWTHHFRRYFWYLSFHVWEDGVDFNKKYSSFSFMANIMTLDLCYIGGIQLFDLRLHNILYFRHFYFPYLLYFLSVFGKFFSFDIIFCSHSTKCCSVYIQH